VGPAVLLLHVLLPGLLRLTLALLLQLLLWAGIVVEGMRRQMHDLHCYLLSPPRPQVNCAKGTRTYDIKQVQVLTVGADASAAGAAARPAASHGSTGAARLGAAAHRANQDRVVKGAHAARLEALLHQTDGLNTDSIIPLLQTLSNSKLELL
jgi:hypothetical protein